MRIEGPIKFDKHYEVHVYLATKPVKYSFRTRAEAMEFLRRFYETTK
jgi:hypothetical protein